VDREQLQAKRRPPRKPLPALRAPLRPGKAEKEVWHDDAPNVGLLSLFLESIQTSNVLLANFLRTCSFISISKDFKSSMGLALRYARHRQSRRRSAGWCCTTLIEPLGINISRSSLHHRIAGVVQMLEMIIDRFRRPCICARIFLRLITVNLRGARVILSADPQIQFPAGGGVASAPSGLVAGIMFLPDRRSSTRTMRCRRA
jgi:hypothetical protein